MSIIKAKLKVYTIPVSLQDIRLKRFEDCLEASRTGNMLKIDRHELTPILRLIVIITR